LSHSSSPLFSFTYYFTVSSFLYAKGLHRVTLHRVTLFLPSTSVPLTHLAFCVKNTLPQFLEFYYSCYLLGYVISQLYSFSSRSSSAFFPLSIFNTYFSYVCNISYSSLINFYQKKLAGIYFCCLVFFFVFLRLSPCVARLALNLQPPASTSQVLRSQVCTTSCWDFKIRFH
jgi:hypothetical protein